MAHIGPSCCQQGMLALDRLEDKQTQVISSYVKRVQDWKGHCICTFGEPLLADTVRVSRHVNDTTSASVANGGHDMYNESTSINNATSSRSYRVILFQNILLCCKKTAYPNEHGRDLKLKGRIFLRDIHSIQMIGESRLNIAYSSDDESDCFLLNFPQKATRQLWLSTLQYHVSQAVSSQANSINQHHSIDYLPTYYSPLPNYAQIAGLSAPMMQRDSPPLSPLTEPPMYTPLPTPEFLSPNPDNDNITASPAFDMDFSSALLRPCRPAMVSSISSSTISSQVTSWDEYEGITSSDEDSIRDLTNEYEFQHEQQSQSKHSLPLYILFPGFAVASFFVLASYASLSA